MIAIIRDDAGETTGIRVRTERVGSPRVSRLAAIWLSVLGAALIADSARAVVVDGLYEVVIEQDDLAENPRTDAIQRAMAEVLVRVTGSRDAAGAAELQPIIASAERRFLNSYAILEDSAVQVGFIGGAVERALEQLNWPVWGEERPATLLWIAVEDTYDGRTVLATGEADTGFEHEAPLAMLLSDMREALAQTAALRGLPYMLPVMDLTDIAAVDFADIWDVDLDALNQASLRYEVDAIAVARVRTSEFGMSVEWMMPTSEGRRLLLGNTLEDGVDWLADQYAGQFGVVGGLRPIQLRISGVLSLRDYGAVMSYLDSISVLERIDVRSYHNGLLTLQASSRGDDAIVARVLGLSNVLALDTTAQPSGFFGAGLDLRVVADPR